MNYFCLHTHSSFCDGKGDPLEYVLSALKKNFHTIGFSSHAPVPFTNNFAIKNDEELRNYCRTIRNLAEEYADRINIYLALEIDYIKGVYSDFQEIKMKNGLDYTIGSVHLVRNENRDDLWFIDGARVETYDEGLQRIFNGNVKQAVTAYYEQVKRMLITQKPDILGHFDKIKMHNNNRYFREDEPWYRDLVMDLLDAISDTGVIPEVNTRGIYKKRSKDLYPGVWILKEMKRRNMPVTLSADAHHPSEIDGYYAETVEILKAIGYRTVVYFKNSDWEEILL
jgi:histidinol-phosphatase (PHP family)